VGNLPNTGCVVLSKAWGKISHKCTGIFTIDAMVILPFLTISHEKKDYFGKFTLKMSHFQKDFHKNKILLENLPFNGNIFWEIFTLGLFPCIDIG
jgi:hypothetical protein